MNIKVSLLKVAAFKVVGVFLQTRYVAILRLELCLELESG